MADLVTTRSAIFGRLVASMRASRGVPQLAFRRLTGLPTGAVERLELGKATATIDHLLVIANWWGCSPGEIMGVITSCESLLRGTRVVLGRRSNLSNAQLDKLIAPAVDAFVDSPQLPLVPCRN